MQERADILLVEKDKKEINKYAGILSSEGHSVSWVLSGKAAIEKVSKGPVDMVLSDITLPDIDSIMLTRSLKEMCGDLFVILMGEWPTVEFTKTAMTVGAYDVLTKPVSAKRLCRLVSTVIAARNFRLAPVDKRSVGLADSGVAGKVEFNSQGLWTAPAEDGVVLVGISAEGWIASGRLIYIAPPEVGTKVEKGQKLFDVVASDGRVYGMNCPFEGEVVEVVDNVESVIAGIVCEPGSECWLTPVLKIRVK